MIIDGRGNLIDDQDDWPQPAFHADSKCAACEGPLEVDRDAICHKCTDQWVAERQEESDE